MVVALTIEKMIQFYHGNIHDVSHFLKVYAFAKTIGELERLTPQTQETLELAAVVHDIACPLCREKYGNTHGKKQELESPPLIENFFCRSLSFPGNSTANHMARGAPSHLWPFE